MTCTGLRSSPLAAAWAKAANLLGVEIIAPFPLELSSGSRLDAAVLVKGFGAPNRMLLVTDYAEVRKHLNELEIAGFGFRYSRNLLVSDLTP